MWARIDSGVVVELVDIDPTGRFHPSLIWVECSVNVRSGWTLSDGQFYVPEPPLTEMHQAQRNGINLACETAITGGFLSDALGGPHTYSSKLDDQLNLTGTILGGSDMPYACTDDQGVKAFRLHTAAQLRQVGDDFTVFKLTLLQKANDLKQQLDQALADSDLAALEAVTWEGQAS